MPNSRNENLDIRIPYQEFQLEHTPRWAAERRVSQKKREWHLTHWKYTELFRGNYDPDTSDEEEFI